MEVVTEPAQTKDELATNMPPALSQQRRARGSPRWNWKATKVNHALTAPRAGYIGAAQRLADFSPRFRFAHLLHPG
jgi:hypothetical protein